MMTLTFVHIIPSVDWRRVRSRRHGTGRHQKLFHQLCIKLWIFLWGLCHNSVNGCCFCSFGNLMRWNDFCRSTINNIVVIAAVKIFTMNSNSVARNFHPHLSERTFGESKNKSELCFARKRDFCKSYLKIAHVPQLHVLLCYLSVYIPFSFHLMPFN